jgi:hypothetical protein
MAKVTFEFDESDNNHDVLLTTKRFEMWQAINELNNFRRRLHNGKEYKTEMLYNLYSESGDLVKDAWSTKQINENDEGIEYLRVDYIEDVLNSILDGMGDVIDCVE